jgi:glycosyltransferase involved in cell wall biosynthesis
MKTSRIRILRIQSRICIGGPAIHTELLSVHLPKDRYQTILLGGSLEEKEKSVLHSIRDKGVDVRVLPEMKRDISLWDDFRSVIKVYRLIRQYKPHIVHTHTSKAGTVGRIAAVFAGTPVILHTFHGHAFENYFSKAKTQFFIWIEKLLAHFSHRLIAISPGQKRDLCQRFHIAPPQKVNVIRLGFDLSRFQPVKSIQLKKQLGLESTEYLGALIGRIVPIKNHILALKVVRVLREEKNVPFHLLIVGDGEEKESLEQRAFDMGIRPYVHFMGWTTRVEEVYKGIDLLLLTSLNEGTPVAIIEAMACKVPVVATAVGGVGDLITEGETGCLAKSNDEKELTEKIKFLFENPEKSHYIVTRAFEFAHGHYHYDRLINQVDRLYQTLLKNPGAHHTR